MHTTSWKYVNPCPLAKEMTDEKMQKESTACVEHILDSCTIVKDAFTVIILSLCIEVLH